jgi:N-acyl-D-amino-acid deacylase
LDVNIKLNFDISLSKESIEPIYILLPRWARQGSLEEMLLRIKSKTSYEQIKNDLPDFDLENIKIANAPFNTYLNGKKLSVYAQEKELNSKEAILRIMLTTSLRATIALENIDSSLMGDIIFDDRAFVGSGGILNSSKTFSEYLKLANERKELSIESIIKKITSLPAKKMGIKNRGVLKEGFFADVVLMRDLEVKHVIVNGSIAIQDGQIKNTLSGKIIKR